MQISHNTKCTSIGTGISIKKEHWNGAINKAVTVQCLNAKKLNSDIEAIYFKYSNALRELDISGVLQGMSVADIRKALIAGRTNTPTPTFNSFFAAFTSRIIHPGTRGIYLLTNTWMQWFAEKIGHCGDSIFTP